MIDKALILDIQRMSTEDGPGLRTTVFFKGCSLSCLWCHNPESINKKIEIQWIDTRCIGCRSCSRVCRNDALTLCEKEIKIDKSKCKSCMSCVDICPSNALEAKGKYMSIDELYNEVLKDRVYFEKSGGGITVSGGEALIQPEFVSGFFKRLKSCRIHTALDTAGFVSQNALDMVLPYTDLILYDIKLMDSEKHKKFTGADNDIILKNLLYIAEFIRNNNSKTDVWIRTPIIPGATLDDDNILSIGDFISEKILDITSRWELCSFNNLCRDKYKRLGIKWHFEDTKLIERAEMERILETAKKTGAGKIAVWSGVVRVE